MKFSESYWESTSRLYERYNYFLMKYGTTSERLRIDNENI